MKDLERLRGQVLEAGKLLDHHGVTHTTNPPEHGHGLDKVTQGANLDKNTAHDMKDATRESGRAGNSFQAKEAQAPPPVEKGSRIEKALEQAKRTGQDMPAPSKSPSMER